MAKRRKSIVIEPEIASELEILAVKENTSFSQLAEEAIVALLENRKELKPENLKNVIEEIVAEALKRQEEIPKEMRKYL